MLKHVRPELGPCFGVARVLGILVRYPPFVEARALGYSLLMVRRHPPRLPGRRCYARGVPARVGAGDNGLVPPGFNRATFHVGRETIDIGARVPLGIYSAERAMIDVIHLRHDQGADQAWEALRRWLARPRRNPGQLVEMARQFHGAERPLRDALAVLL